jgi:hypothetical protein
LVGQASRLSVGMTGKTKLSQNSSSRRIVPRWVARRPLVSGFRRNRRFRSCMASASEYSAHGRARRTARTNSATRPPVASRPGSDVHSPSSTISTSFLVLRHSQRPVPPKNRLLRLFAPRNERVTRRVMECLPEITRRRCCPWLSALQTHLQGSG